MDEQELATMARNRTWKFRSAVVLALLGLPAMIAGFVLGQGLDGDAATAAGMLAGVGFTCLLIGAIFAWRTRPGDTRWMTESQRSKRDRLQSQRASQLFLFPAVAVIFLVLSLDPARNLIEGRGQFGDYLQVVLPVLYAWLTAAIAMGWDMSSRRNRRFLEDELTVVIRARAMTAAFLVVMGGATASLVLLLVEPLYGVVALLVSLAAGGATAGVRFAWLDREAGQDG